MVRNYASIRPFASRGLVAVSLPCATTADERGRVTVLTRPMTPPDRRAGVAAPRAVIDPLSVHRRTVGGTHRAGSTGARHRARVYSLDGLRGVAAVVVFVHHVFLTQPALA